MFDFQGLALSLSQCFRAVHVQVASRSGGRAHSSHINPDWDCIVYKPIICRALSKLAT
jgi:hypothetical protein